MKKFIVFFLAFLILPMTYAQSPSPEKLLLAKPVKALSLEQKILIDKNLKNFPNQTQIALAMIENGEVNFYGFHRGVDEWEKTDNRDHVFEIGSLTKVFTATLLADQIIKNAVGFDDKINELLDIELKNEAEIPIGSLANHTSGLPRLPDNLLQEVLLTPNNPYQNYTEEDLEMYLTEGLTLLSPPGEKMEYSNLGAGVLAYTLKQISEQKYQNLLEKVVFEPYEMTSSTTEKTTNSKAACSRFGSEGPVDGKLGFWSPDGGWGDLFNCGRLG